MKIKMRTRLGPDGTLNLHLSTGLPETDVDVVVLVQPVRNRADDWPSDFFQETYGAFSDQPLARDPQGEWDARDTLG